MKSIFEITRFKLKQLAHSNKYIAPSIFFVFLLYSIYSEASSNIISVFALTLSIQFIICVWIGNVNNELEHEVIEQLIILKVKKKCIYDFSEVLLFVCISAIMSFVAMLYPFILYLMQNEAILLSHIGVGLLFHISVGIMGLGVGSFFHPRFMKNKKSIIVLIWIVTLLSFAKASIIDEYAIFKCILWLLPPMSEILQLIKGQSNFTVILTVKIVGIAVVYYTAQKTLKMFILDRVKF